MIKKKLLKFQQSQVKHRIQQPKAFSIFWNILRHHKFSAFIILKMQEMCNFCSAIRWFHTEKPIFSVFTYLNNVIRTRLYLDSEVDKEVGCIFLLEIPKAAVRVTTSFLTNAFSAHLLIVSVHLFVSRMEHLNQEKPRYLDLWNSSEKTVEQSSWMMK